MPTPLLAAIPTQPWTATPADAPSAAHHPAPAPPTAQLLPTLVALQPGPAGTQQITIQLRPEELGQVQIRILRDPAGAPTVQVTAERPETLALLRQDAGHLHRALDQAGLPQAGRSLSFHPATTPATPGSQLGGQPSGTGQGGAQGGGGSWAGHQPNGRPRPPWTLTADAAGQAPAFTWHSLLGLDLTA